MRTHTLYIGLLDDDGGELYWRGYRRLEIDVPAAGHWTNPEMLAFATVPERGPRPRVACGFAFYEHAGRGEPIFSVLLTMALPLSAGITPRFARGAVSADPNTTWLLDLVRREWPGAAA